MNLQHLTNSPKPRDTPRTVFSFGISTTTAFTPPSASDRFTKSQGADKAGLKSARQADASSSSTPSSVDMHSEDKDLHRDADPATLPDHASPLKVEEIVVKQSPSATSSGTTPSSGDDDDSSMRINTAAATALTDQVEKLPLLAALGWSDDEKAPRSANSGSNSHHNHAKHAHLPTGTTEDDAGVEMLLMMRRNKGKDRPVPLPAPLSKAAIKTSVTGIRSAAVGVYSPSRGLPSSHPYYRSARVLASPQVQQGYRGESRDPLKRTQSDSRGGAAGIQSPRELQYIRPERPTRSQSDIKYEQQKPRSHVVYHYPLPSKALDERQEPRKEIEAPQGSPRVYIPPPVFSPRRYQSNGSVPTQSSLVQQRDEVTRSGSQVGERPAAYEMSAASRLHYLHQPYKPIAHPASMSREQPKYSEYFGNGNGPLQSPIRESFARSEPVNKGYDGTQGRQPGPSLIYAPCDSPRYRSQYPLEAQRPNREAQRDHRGYSRPVHGQKRPAPEEEYTRSSRPEPSLHRIAPRINLPQSLAAGYEAYKRARTDSAESSTSGSNASPPERARIIVTQHGSASKHLVPHTAMMSSRNSSMSSDGSRQSRANPAFRSPSPAGNSRNHTASVSRKTSADSRDLGSILSQLTSGTSNQTTAETARTLADVAAHLVRVAESLKESVR